MAAPSLTYTLTNGATADASQVMQNYNDILNGITDGTKDLSISALTCAGTATLNGHVNLGNASADDLTITASLASTLAIKTNTSFDIGSATKGLNAVYMGGTSTFTAKLIAATLSASRVYTIPEVSADASFVMTQGTQTIVGAKSFSTAMAANAGINVSGAASSYDLNTGGSGIVCNINSSVSNAGAGDVCLKVRFTGDDDATGGTLVQFADGNSSGGSITVNSSACAVLYNLTSDRRLKENIVDLEGGLATVLAIKPRKFNWKKNGVLDDGFIAQELKEVYPQAVSRDESTDPDVLPMGVDYGRLTPILVAAIQELAARLDKIGA